MVVTIKAAGFGTYKDGRRSYELSFYESEKPLGCNVTNRKNMLAIFGDIEWDTASLAGKRVALFKVWTNDPGGDPILGVRIRSAPDTVQAASQQAREKIELARLRQEAATRDRKQPQTPTGYVQTEPHYLSDGPPDDGIPF